MKPFFGIEFDPITPDTRGATSAGAQLSKSAWMWQLAVDSMLLWNPCMTSLSIPVTPMTLSPWIWHCHGLTMSVTPLKILEGPDVSESVQAQSTNYYEETSAWQWIAAAVMTKSMREKSSLSMCTGAVFEVLHQSNNDLSNHLFQQLQLDCGTDNLLPSSSTGKSVIGSDNMLQSSANCK